MDKSIFLVDVSKCWINSHFLLYRLQELQKPVCLHFFQARSGRETDQNKGLLELL